jgi:hypothetical protein
MPIALRVVVGLWLPIAPFFWRFLWIRVDLGIAVIGAACNVLATQSNGGSMPVRGSNWNPSDAPHHQRMTADTKFQPLCERQ